MAQLPEGDPAPADGLLPAGIEFTPRSTFHAYVHVPFCSVRCGYCDFNTYTATELRGVKQESFAATMAEEIAFSSRVMEAAKAPDRQLASVFFGGGTPTQLPAEDLARLLNTLRGNFGIEPSAEITTEANPENISEKYLDELVAAGFTRISFGMQSAVPSVLKTLDRAHNPEKVPLVVRWAKERGMQTSVDLIYGAPGETVEQWQETIDAATALETDHISAYSLIVEPGTKMARMISSGALPEPDEDEQATKYEMADAAFGAAGLRWYELSNWSRSEDTQSRHNIAYWNGRDWWGYGPGAHSHIGGTRWWNVKHPATYTQALAEGRSPALGREILDQNTRAEEAVLTQIRLRDGLPIEKLRQVDGFDSARIAGLIADGLIEASAAFKGSVVLSLKGRLLADYVVRSLIA